MKAKYILLLAVTMIINNAHANPPAPKDIYDFTVNSIEGETVHLSDFKGKVLLIVNTASKCGLTPQYEGLQELYLKYRNKGFEILAFPCNQFLGQEPGTAEEIVNFCASNYHVSFPLFEKIEVNGDHTAPLYLFLKSSLPLEGKNRIRWNFEKFLVDKNGKPFKRYPPKFKPQDLEADIEMLLK